MSIFIVTDLNGIIIAASRSASELFFDSKVGISSNISSLVANSELDLDNTKNSDRIIDIFSLAESSSSVSYSIRCKNVANQMTITASALVDSNNIGSQYLVTFIDQSQLSHVVKQLPLDMTIEKCGDLFFSFYFSFSNDIEITFMNSLAWQIFFPMDSSTSTSASPSTKSNSSRNALPKSFCLSRIFTDDDSRNVVESFIPRAMREGTYACTMPLRWNIASSLLTAQGIHNLPDQILLPTRVLFISNRNNMDHTGRALLCILIRNLADVYATEAGVTAIAIAEETSNKAKSDFMSNMSHEMRTPLNAILGMTNLLIEDGELTTTQSEFLSIIRSSGELLVQIVDDILDLSDLESRGYELTEAPFELMDILQLCTEKCIPLCREKCLDISYYVAPSCPSTLIGDSRRIRQVLSHLLSNAIKFTSQGRIKISVGAEILVHPADKAIASADQSIPNDVEAADKFLLRFSVADTGIGIPKGVDYNRLFLAFEQADNSSTREYGGTGLGLTICQHVVNNMGGRIWIQSEEHVGTTVTFEIILRESGVLKSISSVSVSKLTNLTALIVDSLTRSRKVLYDVITSWNMKCIAVDSATECIKMISHEVVVKDSKSNAHRNHRRFDVVIIDINLNDCSGIELASRIREYKTYNTVPIILIVSMDHPPLSDQQKMVITAILTKPVSSVMFCDLLLTSLSTRRPLPTLMHTSSESCEGGGSICSSDIDRPSKTSSDVASTSAMVISPGPLRILIAEDNLGNQLLVSTILGRMGLTADLADNGQQAVDAAFKKRYHLILMDVKMPVMDGIDDTRIIRASLPKQQQPRILALTAGVMDSERQICMEAGMDDFLTKPIEFETLRLAVEKCRQDKVVFIETSRDDSSSISNTHIEQPSPILSTPSRVPKSPEPPKRPFVVIADSSLSSNSMFVYIAISFIIIVLAYFMYQYCWINFAFLNSNAVFSSEYAEMCLAIVLAISLALVSAHVLSRTFGNDSHIEIDADRNVDHRSRRSRRRMDDARNDDRSS